MKNIFDIFFVKKSRSENVETRFWAKFDVTKNHPKEAIIIMHCYLTVYFKEGNSRVVVK